MSLMRVSEVSSPVFVPGFEDNHDDYRLHAQYTTEKQLSAGWIAPVFPELSPQNKKLYIFGAGVGDFTGDAELIKKAHTYYGDMTVIYIGRELNPHNMWQAVQKLPDLLENCPKTILAFKNQTYAKDFSDTQWFELPWLKEVSEPQIESLQFFFRKYWQTITSPKGFLVPEHPSALVVYPKKQKALANDIPWENHTPAGYDLVVASHAYKLPLERRKNLTLRLANQLAPGGVLFGIHAHGDPETYGHGHFICEQIARRLWPDYEPFDHDLYQFTNTMQEITGSNFRVDVNRLLLPYDIHRWRLNESGTISDEDVEKAIGILAYAFHVPSEQRRPLSKENFEYVRNILGNVNELGKLRLYNSSYKIMRLRL